MTEILSIASPLKTLIGFGKVCIDNNAFRLHYKFTVTILLMFTIMVSTKQFFGDPIYCIGDGDKFKDAINNYCWIYGTHTAKKHYKGVIGKHMAHPGVGPNIPGEGEVYYHYYQWVCFILPLQAALFYTPHALWKLWEGGRIRSLTADLDTAMMPSSWDKERRDKMVKHLISISMYTRNCYFYQFAVCEFLNLVNVIFQIFFLDKFLGGMFKSYGAMVASFHQNITDPIINPMDQAFPKITKCNFEYYGQGGSIQKLDLLCILPLNVFNEKVFLFLWFWLIVLGLISALAFGYRLLILICPCLRAYSVMIQAKLVPKYHVFNIIHQFRVSDWFMLNQISKNVNTFVFKDLIMLLGEELEKIKKVEYV